MTQLPNGWVEVTLGDISVECSQRIPADDEEFCYVDISSVDRSTKTIVGPQQLLGKNAPSRARKEIRTGDVLVSMTRPNLNGVALVPAKLDGQIASTGFDVLRAVEVDPRWLFYIVRSRPFVNAMSDLVQGALYPAVKTKDIRNFKTVLAPIAEQRRIADKLDDLLSRVSACCDRLDYVLGLIQRSRQSILTAATSGELTRGWREKHMVSDAPYPTHKLEDLLREPLRNGKSVKDGDGPRVLRLSSLRAGNIDWSESKQGDWTDVEASRYQVKSGDFLIARGNGSRDLVGRGGLVIGSPPTIAFPDTMIRIRVDVNKIHPEFLRLVWDSIEVRNQIEHSAKTTAGIWKVAQPDLESIVIPVPTLPEQLEIIRTAGAITILTDSIQARTEQTFSYVRLLQQSLLTKALRGDLVSQDPSDEPASLLLDHIRAEKAKSSAVKPKRGRKPQAMA